MTTDADSAATHDDGHEDGREAKSEYPTRNQVLLSGLRSWSRVSLWVIVIALGLALGWFVLGKLWVGVLPVLLSLVLCTVLWPPVRWLRGHGVRPAVAVFTVMVVCLGIIAGVIALIAPSIVDQSSDLGDRAVDGVHKVRDWLQGPPLNVSDDQLNSTVSAITDKLQKSSDSIAQGVFSGVSATTSVLVTLFSAVVISFFFLKDGTRFLPWLRRTAGEPIGSHLSEVLSRMWTTLGGFIRTQAVVSFVDAFFIGLGLVILHVPLAYALALITFVGGFVPIVGAFVSGSLAVLVALVSNGFETALAVLLIILAVQQLEGNILQPVLQSRSMNLHAVIVLLSVTVGGSIFGVIGAFLAVPVVSCLAVLLRYMQEQVLRKSGEWTESDDQGDAEKSSSGSGLSRFWRRGKSSSDGESESGSQGDSTDEPSADSAQPDAG